MKENPRKPWRIVAGILATGFIVYMWVEKDIASTYAMMPKEQLLPLILTTAAVTLLKAGVIASGILLVNWVAGKIKQKQ